MSERLSRPRRTAGPTKGEQMLEESRSARNPHRHEDRSLPQRRSVFPIGRHTGGLRIRHEGSCPISSDRGWAPCTATGISRRRARLCVTLPLTVRMLASAAVVALGGWTVQSTVTLIGIGVTLISAAIGLWLKHRADARSEWWKRTEWALGQFMSNEPARSSLGTAVLTVQLEDKAAKKRDGQMVLQLAIEIGIFDTVSDLASRIIEEPSTPAGGQV